MKIAIQGIDGSFHHQAAEQFFGEDIDIAPCENFEQVFEALAAGVVQRGVVAIENSLYGSINDTYDLLLKYRPYIIGEVYLHVSFDLFAKEDIELESLTDIYSQAPALAETKQFLRDHCPQAKLHEYPDTAMAARYVSRLDSKTAAAISSSKAGKLNGLLPIAQGIEDHKHNYTRFFIISKHETQILEADKTTLILRTSHKPGALHEALSVFAQKGINLSKIESRPIVDEKSWNYIFYVDIEAGLKDSKTKESIKELESKQAEVVILGGYKRGTLPNGIR